MPPSPGPPDDALERGRQERRDLVRLAHANAERQAFELHREQVRLAHDAGQAPDRGAAGCLALILVPIGLLLLTVHPAPGMVVLCLGAVAYLKGSEHLDRSRRQLEQADAEADLRWRNEERRRWQSRGPR
ncbi:hypothetical protein NZK33_15900 [Cyanobium sp. FGCU-6]|nr:hypothetical protein [Cyanobium sp. FGCU6]